ncbi:beta-propeller domain-containing protein [Luteimonas sp. SX5]|uniref:Beta-propeller domain-containing protein n=1 Tax=Luteimonas galliterrae TaxID=2940486 RepID=A0ABT0MLR6_9GAMM|nr:beta-propeller domain-containing protein [Luteimonas galliterrae]MCL1635603.1 beta-propeller domain-containing protein [Luteimonas galliterrae]
MPRIAYLFLALGLLAACNDDVAAAAESQAPDTTPRKTLRAFSGEQELSKLLQRWRAQAERKRREVAKQAVMAPPPPPASAPDSVALMAPGSVATNEAAAAGDKEESITNVQTAGVDEGGIVKRHGDHLVILRRGRLFTVRIGGDALQPVSKVDAYAPGTDPSGAWYDEMLVSENTVVVIGYSYARGGTEIGLFDIDGKGGLAYRATYHLRSNDYYSSRNYASRLIGDQLIFYTPMRLSVWDAGSDQVYPGLRRWRSGATAEDFRRILPATRIYRSDDELDPLEDATLHTVSVCDLGRSDMQCKSSAVLGPEGRVFYVSADSVYVWTTHYDRDDRKPNRAAVFRLPLDGKAPSALKTSGSPIDQLSFLQDGHGYLNVLVSAEGDGDGMWKAETKSGDIALLRVRLRDFGDGSTAAPASAYRPLPNIGDSEVQNRFVGDWLIYGAAPYRWRKAEAGAKHPPAHALRYADRGILHALDVDHGVERIEAMGGDAVLVGGAGKDLHFTSVSLGQRAASRSVFVQRDAAQGESRTHGFFYRNEGERRGIVGLPIVGQARSNSMQRYLDQTASVLYLRNNGLHLGRMGQLDAHAERAVDDGCKASCVDWYGDARPIFIGNRVFALLGYELVEGRIDGERIHERRRADFAPNRAAAIAR